MAIPRFNKKKSDIGDVDDLYQTLDPTLRAILAKTILDGQILSDIALVTGSSNSVSHLLGRDCQGYIVTKRSVDCRIWDDEATNTEKAIFLKLRTSANATVSLWVF